MRVLVVDDDQGIRGVMQKLIRSVGCEAEVCESGEEALDLMRAKPFDILLTDFVMPGISGLTLVEEAKRSSPNMRCVIVSGQPRAADTPPSVAWLAKPIDVDELFDLIDDDDPHDD